MRPMLLLLLLAVVISVTETQYSGNTKQSYKQKIHDNIHTVYFGQVSTTPSLPSSLQMTGESFQPLTTDKLEVDTTITSGHHLSLKVNNFLNLGH